MTPSEEERPGPDHRARDAEGLPDNSGGKAGPPSLRHDHDDAIRRFERSLAGNDRFQLIRELGVGGMGMVFEAFDREQDARVALKTMIRLQANELYRFKKEFRTLANIVHPNLVTLHELFSDGQEWFYTMELVDGTDFISWVRPIPDLGALEDETTLLHEIPLSPGNHDRLREALSQLVDGVRALHREGKLHRDIKPPNVLVRRDGQVRLLDFGLIKDVGTTQRNVDSPEPVTAEEYFAHSLATHGGISGSIGYMAPEQGSDAELTEACDWYGVGVMLFEALTGRRPFLGTGWNVLTKKQEFDAPSPADIADGLPDDLVELCNALLDRDPDVRMRAMENFEPSSADGPGATATPEREDTRLPFFGRRELLARLQGAAERVAGDRTTMIHLHGRSGAGKSALANRFLTEIEEDAGHVILAGRCYEQESVPYKALDTVVDSLTRHLLELPSDEVSALVPAEIAALGRIFPVLERVDAIRNAPPRDIGDPFELRRVAFRAFAELLRRIGDRKRLVLYIDDLQWGDPDSAGFLRDLIESRFPPRLLFLASYRSEYRDRSSCLQALPVAMEESEIDGSTDLWVEDLEVGPLSQSEAEDLAAALLDGDGGDPTRIAVESGGNPYFVYELASLVNSEIDLDERETAMSQLDLDRALWSRVQRLPENPRRILEVIAVSSRPTPIRRIFEAAGVNSSGQPGMAELRAGHLVRRDGPGLDDAVESFHDRIRETILDHLDRSSLSRHHLGLARALENDAESDPEVIAIHYRGAGEFERAGQYFQRAADRAAKALAFDRAAKLYRQTLLLRHLDEAEARELRIKLADALGNAGRGAESAAAYLTAADGLSGDPAHRLQERAGYQYCVAGRIDEGRDCFRGVLRHLGLKLPATRRSALFSLVRRRLHILMRGTGFRRRSEEEIPENLLNRIDLSWAVAGGITVIDPIPAAEFQAHNLLLALRAGEPFRIARALAWEASHTAMVGKRFEGRVFSLLDEATALAQELDEPLARGTVDLARSVAAFFLGDFETCRRFGDLAAEVFRKEAAGAAWELEQSQTFAYWACYWLGDIEELSRRNEALLASSRERGAQLAESQLTTFGGPFVWLAQDRPETASDALARATAHWEDVEYQVYHYTALTAKTQIALYQGKGADAFRMMEEEWRLVAGALLLHVELVRVYMHFLRARCALAAASTASDPMPMLATARTDARALLRMAPKWSKAAGNQTLAALAWRDGDRSTATEHLDRAIDGFDGEGFGLHAWCARSCRDQIRDGREAPETSQWFLDQKIRNPERMVAVNAPGFAPTG